MTEEKRWQQPIKAVGVIGLHSFGRSIVRRLAQTAPKAGVEKLAAFDADAALLADLEESGVVGCKSVAHLVDGVDLILLCLPKTGDVGRIARSHEGLLDCVRKNQIIIDHSWSSLDLTRQLGTAFSGRGAVILDAPIGRRGNVDRAIEAGKLAFAIGGDASAIDAALPLLACFASDITRVGPIGTAQVARQLGDLVALQTFAALAEAFVTGYAFGVEGDRLFEALAKENGASVGLGRHALAEFLGGDEPAPNGRTSIIDAGRRLKEAIQLAEGKNLNLEGADSTLALLDKAIEKGLGEEDLGGLFRVMEPEQKSSRRDVRSHGSR
ncbi:MAG: NAD(P)-binding domain-containing protein [Pseudomonadota bacterium]